MPALGILQGGYLTFRIRCYALVFLMSDIYYDYYYYDSYCYSY